MATLDWPMLPAFKPVRFALGASTPKSRFAGFYSAQSQTISHMADRLRVEMALPPCVAAAAAERESFLMQLASTSDTVRLPHFGRPQLPSEMRGSTLVYAAAAAGARTLRIGKATTLRNFLTATQSLDSAYDWDLLSGLTVTPNTHARANGTSITADSLNDNSVTQTGILRQSVIISAAAQTYTASVYVRKTSGGTSATFELQLTLAGGTGSSQTSLRVNTDDGQILSGAGNVVLSNDGLYWYVEASITNSAAHTLLEVRFYPARAFNGSSAPTVAATGTAVLWGAQLELGPVRTVYDGTPDLLSGEVISVGGQLLVTGYGGGSQNALPYLDMPLALPLRRAVAAGESVTWFQPTGVFELLSDVSQFEYLPGRYQSGLTLAFQEVL